MKSMNLWNKLIKISFAIFALYMIFHHIQVGANDRLLSTASVFLVILIPFLVDKILHYKMSDTLELVFLIFILLAHILGSVINLYSVISWWDLFTHGLSGILTSILAILILKQYKLLNKKTVVFTIIFMLCFSLAIASGWEFFEFTLDKITGKDTQWVISSGVDDTMTDMLIAMVGTMVFAVYYLFAHQGRFLSKMEKSL